MVAELSVALFLIPGEMFLKVSVIIPALNEARFITTAIASASKCGANEVIVVDGGSDDQTVELSRACATVIQMDSPGRAVQQNAGAAAATGEVLLFLHADCCLPADAVEQVVSRLDADSRIVAGCFKQQINQNGLGYRMLAAGNDFRARICKWAYGDQGIFVRSNAFDAVGGFPAIELMEDLYLMKRLKAKGRIVLLEGPLLVSARRWQRRGILQQTLRNWALVIAAHLGASPKRLAGFYPNDR